MKEAREGCAPLEDVDKHTFVRFCEYLYPGNDQPANCTILFDELSVQCEDDEKEPQESLSESSRGEDRPPAEAIMPRVEGVRTSRLSGRAISWAHGSVSVNFPEALAVMIDYLVDLKVSNTA